MVEIGGTPGLNRSINIDTTEFMSEATDSFSPPVTDTSLKNGNRCFYYPIADIEDEAPIEFVVRKDMKNYIDMTGTRLHGCFKIVKDNGTDIGELATDNVSICNLFPHTLFKIVDVHLNDNSVVDLSSATYHYGAFLNIFLSYGKNVKESMLEGSSLYIEDDVENFPPNFDTTNDRKALLKRNSLIKNSQKCHFVIELQVDVLKCPRLLPPNVEIKFNFIRNDKRFGILSPTADYKVKLISLNLEIKKITVDDKIFRNYQSELLKKNATFPFTQTKRKHFVIPTGACDYTQATINGVNSRLPRQVNLICLKIMIFF